MPIAPLDAETRRPVVETHLLGRIDFHRCLKLQKRLVDRIGERDDGQIRLLLGEHPPIITVGRGGSPGDVRLDADVLRTRQIELCWVKRGGGCLVHLPGQLAVYPIFPLRWYGLTVGRYLDRLQAGILGTLDELGVPVQTRPASHDIWGRPGRLVAVGVAVRNWVTCHGAFINVCPPLGLFRLIQEGHDPDEQKPMSCLTAERIGRVTMTTVRATLIRHLTESLGCDRYHIYTGYPVL